MPRAANNIILVSFCCIKTGICLMFCLLRHWLGCMHAHRLDMAQTQLYDSLLNLVTFVFLLH